MPALDAFGSSGDGGRARRAGGVEHSTLRSGGGKQGNPNRRPLVAPSRNATRTTLTEP